MVQIKSVAWDRKFFDNGKALIKWQRFRPYEKFTGMVERHGDSIAVFCQPENKVSLWLC